MLNSITRPIKYIQHSDNIHTQYLKPNKSKTDTVKRENLKTITMEGKLNRGIPVRTERKKDWGEKEEEKEQKKDKVQVM